MYDPPPGRFSHNFPYQVSALQLLHYQAPQAAVLTLLVSPFFDETERVLILCLKALANPSYWTEVVDWAGIVVLSCLLAFLVNLSSFLVIGRTSPVSFQVKLNTL